MLSAVIHSQEVASARLPLHPVFPIKQSSACCVGLYRLFHCTDQHSTHLFYQSLLNLLITCVLSFGRLCPQLWSYLAVGRCLKMEKTLPAAAPQKVASQTSSSTREMAQRRQSTPPIPTQRSNQAIAPPQAHLRTNLWTNQSCSSAWSTSSSFSPDLLPCILRLSRQSKLGVKEMRFCSQGPWCQRTVSTVIIWSSARDQGWSRGIVLLLSLLLVNSA